MGVQTVIERKLRKGVIGAIADSSMKRGRPFRVNAGTSSVAASLAVTVATNVVANDTITIAGQTYKFVASVSEVNDVKVGTTAADSASYLAAAITGGAGAGTNYGTGTVVNAKVTASVASAVITLTAKEAGYTGNLLGYTTSDSAATKFTSTGKYLTGGKDEQFPACVGRAYTFSATEGVVDMGGTGAFAGIMVGPSEYANRNNLKDSLCVPNNTVADLLTFGRIWVRVTGAVTAGQVACFKQSDGSFVGVGTLDSAPSGYTKLDKSVFITAADAGDIATVELSY